MNALTRRRLLIDCAFVAGGLFAASSLSALSDSPSPTPSFTPSKSATPKADATCHAKPGESVAVPAATRTPRSHPLPGRMPAHKPTKKP